MSESGDTFQNSNTENENSKKTRKKYFNETKDYDGHDRIYAREEDYCDHYYENEIPLKRVTELLPNTGRRHHMRRHNEKSNWDDERFLWILYKKPNLTIYIDPRDPEQRLTLIVLEKMWFDCPNDTPYKLVLVDCFKGENKKLKMYGPNQKMPIMDDHGFHPKDKNKIDMWANGSWTVISDICQAYQNRHNPLLVYPTEMRRRCHCDQILFQSYDLMLIVMEEYPNINGVILRGETPDESKYSDIVSMMRVYDGHLARRPTQNKWYQYCSKNKGDGVDPNGMTWFRTPKELKEMPFMGDRYFNLADIFSMMPLLTMFSTGLVTEERLFQKFPRVKKWYNRCLEHESKVLTDINKKGMDDLANCFKSALNGKEIPELKLDTYKGEFKGVTTLTRLVRK